MTHKLNDFDGERLKRLLADAGMKPKDLAAHPRVQCDIRTVERWIAGGITMRPRIKTLLQRILTQRISRRGGAGAASQETPLP